MRKILIADDVKANREILKKILGTEYDVIEAENGEEAMALMHQNYKLLSAVILDIIMPVMDGYQVLKKIRNNASLSQIPTIVVTSENDEESRVKALAYGANDFIGKPYNPDIIKHCLRNSINLRENASIINALQNDKLTGILTREAFFDKVTRLTSNKTPGLYVLACFDIDNFKLINDQYGAQEGDRILRHIGGSIKEMCDHIDGICGRISGDNFAGLYPNTKETLEYVEKYRDIHFLPKDVQSTLMFSVGRYVVSDINLSASAMYDRAYIAKQSTKGIYDKHMAYFDEEMLNDLIQEQQITSEMAGALADNQFEVWFQPQMNYATGAKIGAEALVRWRHPSKGLISPGIFIPIFEENGFIYELDKFVWEETCRYLRKWIDENRNPLPVSVNISRRDLFREDLLDVLLGLLKKYDLPKELMRVEVTESAFEKSTSHVIDIVKRIIDCGFVVEIDDFGSGYSSLNTLKDVPASVLKLDMLFFDEHGDSERSGNIVESVVRMARWIGMAVLAEGVEKKEQADFLKSVGCNYIQGFYHAKPMPADEYEKFMLDTTKEEKLITMETVEHLDNSSFWDPKSMDTLVFNSYVGGACIFEYKNNGIELLRFNDIFAEEFKPFNGQKLSLADMDIIKYADPESQQVFYDTLKLAINQASDKTCEIHFAPNICDKFGELYFRLRFRAIAKSGDIYLFYCLVNNITEQREAENSLLKAKNQLQLVNDSIPGGLATYICDCNGENALVSYFNDGFCKIFGYGHEEYEELCKIDVSGRVLEEDLDVVLGEFRRCVIENVPMMCTYRIKRRDGCIRWIKHRGTVMERTSDQAIVGSVFLDITDEVETAERARMSEEEYCIAIKNSGNSIFRFIISDKSLTMSKEVAKLYGIEENIKNAPYQLVRNDFISQGSVKTFVGFFDDIIDGGRTGKAIFQWKTPAGWKWIEAHSTTIFSDTEIPVSAVISMRDITGEVEKENVYNKWQQSLLDRDPKSYTLFRCNLSKDSSYDVREGNLISVSPSEEEVTFDEVTLVYAKESVYELDKTLYIEFLKSDNLLAKYHRGQYSSRLEYREKIHREGFKWIRLTVDLIEYPESTDVGVFLMYEDIDVVKRNELSIIERADADELTGTLSKNAFMKKMNAAIGNGVPGAKHALLMLDIDQFKEVNETYGHAAGDKILADIASRIRQSLREEDFVGKLAGDEFVIFIHNILNDSVAADRAKEIGRAVNCSMDNGLSINASIGISVCPRDGSNFDTLFNKADTALYRVKRSAKGKYDFYHEEIMEDKEAKPEVKPPAYLHLETKKHMLIVENNSTDLKLLESIFEDEFLIDKAIDGKSALIRLEHYGAVYSVVLLDLIMPGISGFEVLRRMQKNTETKSIPVIVVSGDDKRDTYLNTIICGAVDFVPKPVDPDLLKIRVTSAISKAENERLHAQNNYLQMQNDEIERYRIVLKHAGIAVIENDWVQGTFSYGPEVSSHIGGTYDGRKLWRILLSDMVTDTATVRQMQSFLSKIANDRKCMEGSIMVQLKTPSRVKHWFEMTVYKKTDDFNLTDKLILAFVDKGVEPESDNMTDNYN